MKKSPKNPSLTKKILKHGISESLLIITKLELAKTTIGGSQSERTRTVTDKTKNKNKANQKTKKPNNNKNYTGTI